MRLENAKRYIQSFQKLTDKYLEIHIKHPFAGLDFNPQYESSINWTVGLFIEVKADIVTVSFAGRFLITNIPLVNGKFSLQTRDGSRETYEIKDLRPIRENWDK